ncbi:hypothetical protein CEXT_683191 [Caerostris extrusa]|uniref:F-box domain-containing protein n=1 Tax=Caerostris extrusa TaxID=172846 RepID=A0AAV4V8C6_CAEEX|nr:hypothetical protein CEXT_683191 [Caerostris extrusa]
MQSEESAGPLASSSSKPTQQRKQDWDRLPTYALERIFSFLNHRDRSKASVVCKSWAEATSRPVCGNRPSSSSPRISTANRSLIRGMLSTGTIFCCCFLTHWVDQTHESVWTHG